MSNSLTLRHLHFVGVDHSHNLFDGSSSNVTSSEAVLAVDGEATLEEMELENRKRAITMSILFCALMVFYVGFCFYYQKVHKVRRRIGDSAHQHPRGTARRDGREQQLRSNRAVLDESSDAAHRARSDGQMARKFEERRDKIRAVLITRLLVDDHRHGGADLAGTLANAGEKSMGSQEEVVKQSSLENLESNQISGIDINATVTLSTSHETCDSVNNGDYDGHPAAAPTVAAASSASASCVDFKKYADALQSSISSGTRFVCSPQNANYCSGGGGGGGCSNSNHNGCSNSNHSSHHNTGSNHPNTHSSHPDNDNGSANTMLSILLNEECNICLSSFQVGDRIAWSCKNQTQFTDSSSTSDNDSSATTRTTVNSDAVCRHIFHAECIERWLLVREGCPVCRRSYFEDLEENDPGEVSIGNGSVRNDVVMETREEEEVDLEWGDGSNTHEEVMGPTSAVTPLARVVAVEE
ncbi:hypothetical protein HJC23_013256 [Cyclotella cryptica]|uniref:RING-type domain-containing protein n=1 Tax=Cyclotella cryptica TaxID=29204 RepID=A0ABD3PHY4_9STRA|eukprot:CCRYP_014915-RA/>CCRYP_014915-RA protein AED:0.23 eAED:0.23 QI:307/1/1/1/0/0/2/371/467